jgi:hypothetical protein
MFNIELMGADLDEITKKIAEICADAPDVAAKYDAHVPALSKSYHDAFGADKFSYVANFMGPGKFVFEDSQETHYGYLLGIVYAPAGELPANHRDKMHKFVLAMKDEEPTDFYPIRNNTLH